MSRSITVPMIKGNLISINVDRILYAYPDGEKETIVDCGGDDFVAVALSFEDFSKLIYAAEGEWLTSEIDSTAEDDETELYTGDARCIMSKDGLVKGFVYQFENGYTTDDAGKVRPYGHGYTAREINEWFDKYFVKIE